MAERQELRELTWTDREAVRHSWVATVLLVVAGLVTDDAGWGFVARFFLLFSLPAAVAFLWRSIRHRDARAVTANALGLALATLATFYAFAEVLLRDPAR